MSCFISCLATRDMLTQRPISLSLLSFTFILPHILGSCSLFCSKRAATSSRANSTECTQTWAWVPTSTTSSTISSRHKRQWWTSASASRSMYYRWDKTKHTTPMNSKKYKYRKTHHSCFQTCTTVWTFSWTSPQGLYVRTLMAANFAVSPHENTAVAVYSSQSNWQMYFYIWWDLNLFSLNCWALYHLPDGGSSECTSRFEYISNIKYCY